MLHDDYGVDYENSIGSYRTIKRDSVMQCEIQYYDNLQEGYDGEKSDAGYIYITFCEAASEDAYTPGICFGFVNKEHLEEMLKRLADCIINHKHCLDGRGLDFITMIIE